MDPLKAIFGKNIKALRTKHGLSQGQLGTAIGVTYQTIGRIEEGGGATDLDTVEALSRELSTGAAALVSDGDWRRILERFPTIEKDEADYLCRVLADYRDAKSGKKTSNAGTTSREGR